MNYLTLNLKKSFFLVLFPYFFVLHGYVENYPLVPFIDSLKLAGYYLVGILFLTLVSLLIFRSLPKACLFVFALFCIQFFFGSIHDFLKHQLRIYSFTKYSIIIPATVLLIVFIFIALKRSKRSFNRLTKYLTIVVIFLITYDVIQISLTINKNLPSLEGEFQKCDICIKPDIYLIVADEYAGKQELKEKFYFDNSGFEKQLRTRGFHIVQNSRSNYNFTPFSVGSLLNMSFLTLKDTASTLQDVPMVMKTIEKNKLTIFLAGIGYKIYNHSIFDLPGEPTQIYSSFLPYKTKYITAQTFTDRVMKDIGYHLITTLKIERFIKKQVYSNLISNKTLYKKTFDLASVSGSPKFSYTHLSMPHPPYYYDEKGNSNPYNLLSDDKSQSKYISYLKYSNEKLIQLIDKILSTSAKPPMIFLLSDHGFRSFESLEDRKKYSFMNFMAVYKPDQNYTRYYDGLSLVNVFRIALNQQFNQNLPLLEDKTYFLTD